MEVDLDPSIGYYRAWIKYFWYENRDEMEEFKYDREVFFLNMSRCNPNNFKSQNWTEVNSIWLDRFYCLDE